MYWQGQTVGELYRVIFGISTKAVPCGDDYQIDAAWIIARLTRLPGGFSRKLREMRYNGKALG